MRQKKVRIETEDKQSVEKIVFPGEVQMAFFTFENGQVMTVLFTLNER